MKTRIISGIVMALIVVAVLLSGLYISSLFITFFVGLLAAGAIYELCHNASGIKAKAAWIIASCYGFLNVAALDKNVYEKLCFYFKDGEMTGIYSYYSGISQYQLSLILTVLYFLLAVILVLKNHKDFGLAQIVSLCAMPLFVSYAFSCLGGIIGGENGIYYLVMLLNFSSICDMGAYFVGVTLGKHKLCPEISPKKTIEGAIGGIVSSLVFSVVFVFAFGMSDKLISTLILTIPLCIVGMIGDLFASSIKRSVGLKDYSNLIPGHGGILDRTDSILMIAPILYLCTLFGVI